ncbi:MAG: MlaA family lipoprotein [Caldimonas sp.]
MKSGVRPCGALLCFALLSLMLLAGCSTVRTARGGPGQKLDPWENWNRKVFAFNEGLDRRVLVPVATTYADVVPQPVRRGVGNFFGNFADAWSAVNNMLQGRVTNGFQDVLRVGTNTIFGIFGVFDVASEMGFDHQYEDFGQTLGRWGFGAGAYIVLPVFGPSSVRDAVGLPLDRLASPALLINDGATQAGIITLHLINTRASLLGATRIIDEISLDKYTFVRDGYLQRRRSLVFNGDVPETPDQQGADEPDGAAAAAAPGASAPAGGASAPAAAASSARPASGPRQ